MARKDRLSLEEARRTGNIKRFIAERQEEGSAADKGRFNALLNAMARTPGATVGTKSKKKRRRAY